MNTMASNQGANGSTPQPASTSLRSVFNRNNQQSDNTGDNQRSDNTGAPQENNPGGPSNLTAEKQEETISHKDHSSSILQQELENGNKEVVDGTVCLRVAEVSLIATIALHSNKDDKAAWKVKLTCGSDYPRTKPTGEILEPICKRRKVEDMNLPSMENWNNDKKMVDILNDIKEVMKKETTNPHEDKPN